MARTINQIQAQLIANVQADPQLSQLTSTSRRAIWRLWTYVIAVSINILEQLMDIFTANTEATIARGVPLTAQWFQQKCFEFQYDATNPQVLQLIDLIPQYPVVNPALRIVTRASVRTDLSNIVKVKVAKSAVPEPLTVLELAALQSYIDILGTPGVRYVVESTPADKLYIEATVYYSGGYSSVIQDNVIRAILNYFAAIPFDGTLKMSDLENVVRNTTGVTDVVFANVQARSNSTAFGSGTNLVSNYAYVSRLWPTVAGYIVEETTSGQTFADKITFIAE